MHARVIALFLSTSVSCWVAGCGGETTTVASTVPESADLRPPSRYRVELGAADATALDVTLFMAALDAETTARLPDLPGRGAREVSIDDVVCDETPVQSTSAGFALPRGCEVLRYRVSSAAIGPDGYDPTELNVAHDPETGAWFVPGAALFLVPEVMTDRPRLDMRLPEGVTLHHNLDGERDDALMLPPPTALGRLLMGFGGWTTRAHADGAMQIQYLANGPIELATAHPAPPLASAYITRVVGGRPPTKLLVFMFPVAAGRGTLSSASGDDAIAVGYWAEALPDDAPVLSRVAPHISYLSAWFDLLSGRSLPTWASVSLGRYYALKGLVHARSLTPSDMEQYLAAVVPRDGDRTALLSAESRFANGERGARTIFGKEGIGFWAAVDDAIREGSEGQRSLDDVLTELIGLIYQNTGTPPQRFLILLDEAGVPDAEALASAWLGWP